MSRENQTRPTVQSAGVIVLDWAGREVTALCVSAYGMWDFPKGRLEQGESHLEAAIRELMEETSISIPEDAEIVPGAIAPKIVYSAGNNTKIATYFVAERISRKTPFLPVNPELGMPENNAFRWIPVSKLHKMMPARLAPVVSYVEDWLQMEKRFES